jgi:transcriptional regulator with XRE-family HTH domain
MSNDRARTAAYVIVRRGQLGLSQQQLAELAHVDTKTINSLETGRRWPQPKTRARIAEALGWTARSLQDITDGGEPTLLDEAGPPGEQAGDDQYLADIMADLDDDEAAEVARYARYLIETRRTLAEKATETNARGQRGAESRKGA